jgi:hypothetical protein
MQAENLPRFRKSGGYVYFELEGTLAYSQEGLVFGVLPVQSGEKSSTGGDGWKL